MLRNIVTVCLLGTLLVCRISPSGAQDSLPAAKETWIAKLAGLTMRDITGYQTLREFIVQDPELVFAVLRDGLGKIKDPNVRSQLISMILQGNGNSVFINGVERSSYKPNPHLLDIFELLLADSAQPAPANGQENAQSYQRQQILQELTGIGFRNFSGLVDFKQWRNLIGDRPIADVIQENCRRIASELDKGDPETRLQDLDILRKLSYYSGTSTSSNNGVVTRSHTASGLTKIRRDAFLGANLPAVLGSLMRPANPVKVRQDSLRVLARFQPDDKVLAKFETDIKRELPPLFDLPPAVPDRANPFRNPDNFTELLTEFDGDWTADLVVKKLQKDAEKSVQDHMFANSLQYFRNPRIIPTLISLVDFTDERMSGFNPYENALRQITHIAYDGNPRGSSHDSLWWRIWWHDNKKRYSADVQKLTIPVMHKTRKNGIAVELPTVTRRRVERVSISEDPQRSYWLLSPGAPPPTVLSRDEKAAIANSGLKKLAAVKGDRPGLIVVLLSGDTEDLSLLDTWLDVADALDKRYFVAIAIRPRWSERTGDHWITQKDRADAPTTAITTEVFAEQIAQQMKINAALDTDRIYLAGQGKAGSAALTCALRSDTAYRGYCLLSAPFRSAMLPSLKAAKGRRFFLALGMREGGAWDALASAAEPILRQAGATVQTEKLPTGTEIEALQHAIRWFER